MKKLLSLFVSVLAVATVQASVLYWQVTRDDYSSLVDADRVNAAELFAYDLDHGVATSAISMIATNTTDEYYTVEVGNYSSGNYAFYVEVVNYSSAGREVLGTSFGNVEKNTYTALNNVSISGAGLGFNTMNVWHGGGVAAPEPTSAMMILLGLAGLALKRKQV